MGVYRVAYVRVAGDVDVHRAPVGQRGDLLVGDEEVVHLQAARELRASGRAQPDHLAPPAARQQERERARGLAGGARYHEQVRAQQAAVVQEIVEQIGGEEQRAQQHLLVLVPRVIRGVGLHQRIGVVGLRQRRTMRRAIDESVRLDAHRRDRERG